MSDERPREIVERRLREASLGQNRFVDVVDEKKKCFDHTPVSLPDEGNFGIYARGNDCLVLIDVDDYNDFDDTSGLAALAELPPTLEQQSAHGGTHRIYRVRPTDDGKLIAAVMNEVFGCENPDPSWGEVRTKNQLILGAGSKLDANGCTEDNCTNCAKPDGGRYTVQADREIETIDASDVVSILEADPDIDREDVDTDASETETPPSQDVDPSGGHDITGSSGIDTDERLEFALEHDEKLRRLWNGNYSDYRTRGDEDRSRAESALAMKLAFWFEKDKPQVRKLMDRADTKKWCEREDSSYRDATLEAVDKQNDTFEPDADGGAPASTASTDGGMIAAQNTPPAKDVGMSDDTPTLTRQSLRSKADLDEGDSIHDLTDRQKAAFTWRLMKESDTTYIRTTGNDEILAYDPDTGIWIGEDEGSERALKEAARKPLPPGAYGSNVFEQLKSIIEADPAGFVARDELGVGARKLVVQNGVLDLDEAYRALKTGEGVDTDAVLSELTPTDYAVSRLEYEFNPDADTTAWRGFVDDVIESEMIALMQEYLGSCLYDGHLAEKALLLVGGGENGKSTFLNIVREVFGESNISSVTPAGFRNRNALARMENKTVNIAAEISGQTMQGEALNRFKNLTGNDSVQVERKYKSPFQLNFTGGMLFATNDAPDVTHVDDGDVAFWRRWETVHFPNSFPEGSEKRDPEIEERLKGDSNLSAILNWMILGYGRFRHENDCTFTNARDHIDTQTIWQSWGDALDRFLNTVVEQDEDAADISTREAFEVFKHWCREEGESVDITQAQFTPQAKKKSLGYSKGIDTRRDSQVNAFTAFGTPDELDDPIDIIAAGGGSNDSDAGGNTGIDDFDDADAASSDGDPERSDTREEDVENSEDAEANDSPAENDSEATADGGTVQTDADGTKPDTDTTQPDTAQSDTEAANTNTDGTQASRSVRKGKIQAQFTLSDGPLKAEELADELGWKMNQVKATLSDLKDRGTVIETREGYVTD